MNTPTPPSLTAKVFFHRPKNRNQDAELLIEDCRACTGWQITDCHIVLLGARGASTCACTWKKIDVEAAFLANAQNKTVSSWFASKKDVKARKAVGS